jgi:hypothetical protein
LDALHLFIERFALLGNQQPPRLPAVHRCFQWGGVLIGVVGVRGVDGKSCALTAYRDLFRLDVNIEVCSAGLYPATF